MLNFIPTAARTRCFSDEKLQKLYSSPAIIRDRSAFVEWMNNLTNEILGLSDIEGETSQLIAAAASFPATVQHAIGSTAVRDTYVNNSNFRPEPLKPSLDRIRSQHGNIFVADGTDHQSNSVAAGISSISSYIQVSSEEQISAENLSLNIPRDDGVNINNLSEDEPHSECHVATEFPTRMSVIAPYYFNSDDNNNRSHGRDEDLLERNEDTMPVHLACNVYSKVDDSSLMQNANIDVTETADDESEPERGLIILHKMEPLGTEPLHDNADGIFCFATESCLVSLRSSSISSACTSSIDTSHSCQIDDLATSTCLILPIDAVLETAFITDAGEKMLNKGQIELCDELDLSGHWQLSGKNSSGIQADYSPASVFTPKDAILCQEQRRGRSESIVESFTMETKGLSSLPHLRRDISSFSEARCQKNEEFYMNDSKVHFPRNMATERSTSQDEGCGDTVGYSTLGKSVDLSRMTFQVSKMALRIFPSIPIHIVIHASFSIVNLFRSIPSHLFSLNLSQKLKLITGHY